MPTFYNSKKDPAAAERAQDEREVAKAAQEAEDANQSKHSKNNTSPSYVSRQSNNPQPQ
jgi:hypothetical protein